MEERPIIVISAIRFFQGGTIVIVNECLWFLSRNYSTQYKILALVYDKSLFDNIPAIEWIEFPKARKSVLRRLYYEYFYLKKRSLIWKPILWLSLQDSTPNIKAAIRVAYYHNPLLLKPAGLHLWKFQPRLSALWLLYKFVYTKGMNRNDYIITQQQHVAQFLAVKYVNQKEKLWVFPPKSFLVKNSFVQKEPSVLAIAPDSNPPFTFIFPATAFHYKNYELLLAACEILNMNGLDYRLLLTVDGSENKYIRNLVGKWKKRLPQVKFLGFLNRSDLFDYYLKADCMVYPSLLESWGLPLTEFSNLEKPIICTDLPYGRESLAGYTKVRYFDPDNPETLAAYMTSAIKGQLNFNPGQFKLSWQHIDDWKACFELLLSKVQ